MARASILWLIGEYCHLIPKIAPDVLRKAAKSFTSEVSGIALYLTMAYPSCNLALSKLPLTTSFVLKQAVNPTVLSCIFRSYVLV